ELRLKNIVREGEEGPTGQVLTAVGLEECLRRAADAIGWRDRRPRAGRGKGIACGWWTTTGGSSGVYIKVNPDGTIALNTGAGEGKRATLGELARISQASGGGLIAHGTFVAPPTPYDAKRVEGHVYPAFHSPSFHAHAADLSVDAATGEITIHRYVVAQDVG